MKSKKSIFIVLSIIGLAVGFNFGRAFFRNSLLMPIALADDENEGGDDDSESSGGSKAVTVVTYKTVYVKLPDTVAEKIIQVPLHDSDSDGIYDNDDPYPHINKFFVVSDKNLNGIDDEYEKFSR